MLKVDELMSGKTKEAAYTLGFLWGDGHYGNMTRIFGSLKCINLISVNLV